jgi:hypothetical protein
LAFDNAGSNNAARMAMIAMTTSNSTSVKAIFDLAALFIQDYVCDRTFFDHDLTACKLT